MIRVSEGSIPVGAFIEALPKRSSACVGLCTLAEIANTPLDSSRILSQIAREWSRCSNRSCCVVSAVDVSSDDTVAEKIELKSARWDWLGTDALPTGYSAAVARDVAGLSKLRAENGLILIELGRIESQACSYAAKLCDGLVLLAPGSISMTDLPNRRKRGLVSKLRSLQSAECPWLGFWSLV
ncbi:MAG: hypothetical protein ACKOAU_00130 [Pirellula sp.]